ncbi:thioester reductase domain-containing protein [Nocardiopsis salina]|uniref:thioester reductase domain-containing protein n=1 Tax=Nocardiopsis salina TaxID=245836 RepID=UPI00034DBF8D|nr:thioester reductase domain-containing protein [Nocardiopsis salina]
MTDAQHLTNNPLPPTTSKRLRGLLREFAGSRLAGAVVPKEFVVLHELPKLPNGKVDRDRLPEPRRELYSSSSHVAPRTPQEERVASVWRDVLGVRRVGVHDDFFDLGGGSLTAAQMAARLREETGASVNARQIFDHPTIERLALMLSPEAAVEQSAPPQHPRSIPTNRLLEEARLAPDVTPAANVLPPVQAPYRCVLLTGATGYTGAFLLRELIDRSQAHVYVLVRATEEAEARQRVVAAMRRYGLARDGDVDRISCVVGDLARPYFALSRDTYEELGASVEMIIHNGASSSYALPYRRLKPVNTLGTLEALRLASRHRIKPVHYISSLAVYPGRRGDPRWTEAPVPDPRGVVGGYRQSKWVGDSMMSQAAELGIPTCVYRPGLIVGSQSRGACSTDTLLNAAIKGCIQLGAALDFDATLELVPADYCAAAVAHIALTGTHANTIFNLPGSRSITWNDFVGLVAAHGYAIESLPYQDWYQRLRQAVDGGEENELARFLPLFGRHLPAEDLGYEGSRPVFEDRNLHAALEGSGIVCAEPDTAFVGRFLDWFAAAGYLPGPPAHGHRG